MRLSALTFVLVMLLNNPLVRAEENPPPPVEFKLGQGNVVILVDEQPIATYQFEDPTGKTPRPFFAHVKAPNGVQVTRNHPPVPGKDRLDHDTMHPGIWLAFGDLDGHDFWRNKATVKHLRFSTPPREILGHGSFVEEKQYLRADGSEVCRERFDCHIRVRRQGYLLMWDSTFHAEREFYFGDQEEMGLGIRVASPISELADGRLTDSKGRSGAPAIWSQSAKWCDYSGLINGQRVGLTLMCHPDNFRPSWMHARNYGFVAANPFGRKAMNKGASSKIFVKPGETLRLRYAVLVHSLKTGRKLDLDEAYADYVRLAGSSTMRKP